MAGCSSCCGWPSFLATYGTPKKIIVKNKCVACTYWFIILAVIGFIAGYPIATQKGYQEFDDIISSVTTKLQGVAYPNRSDVDPTLDRVWDSAGLVVPPQQRDGFFVMTNMIITPDQSQGTCAEAPWVGHNVSCTDSDTGNCPAGKVELSGNGMFTGKCANFNNELQTCEIRGWCPVEQQQSPPSPAVLEGAKEFTVLLKNTISFPKFRFTKRNVLNEDDPDHLKKCRFDARDPVDKYCPIFKLETIVREANQDFTILAEQGGVIGIIIRWDCNLDRFAPPCLPKYSFTRLDKAGTIVSPGYNFRYARYYKQNDKNYRTLIKAYGIRFDVLVDGQAGKFNLSDMVANVAHAVSLFGLAAIVCNNVLLYFYGKKKNEVDDEGALFLMEACCSCCSWCRSCCCSCCCSSSCCNSCPDTYERVEEGALNELPGTQEQDDENIKLTESVPNYGSVQSETVNV